MDYIHDAATESALKTWRVVGITSIVIAVMGFAALIYLVTKVKRGGRMRNYEQMSSN